MTQLHRAGAAVCLLVVCLPLHSWLAKPALQKAGFHWAVGKTCIHGLVDLEVEK